jgi:hypothetical protein
MIEAGIGGGVMQGTSVSGFGIGGRVDQTGETAGMGGAGAHGAWLQGSVEGAARQAPATRGGGCPADREQFGVGCGVTRSLALVGSDGKYLPSPGDHSPDGNLAPFCGDLSGEEGAAHHGEVGVGEIVSRRLNHEAIIAFQVRLPTDDRSTP